MPLCSIIILNWNGEEMLRQFLSSVIRHTQLPNCEIVVADNGSTDNSLQVLRQEFPIVKVLPFEQNYGFAEGYNKAIEATEAQYVVLLNSDVEVTPNWLKPILSYLDEHKDVAAVQPKVLKWTQGLENQKVHVFEHAGAAGGYMDTLGYPFCRGRIMDYVEEDHGQYDTPADIFWATGACMIIRRDVYLKEGGLDADFFAHMEEIDLCWRLNARGYRLVCLPESVVYHVGGGSLAYNNPRKTFLNFRNNLLMIYKNVCAKQLRKILFARFVMDYMAACVYLLKGEWGNFKAVCKARCAFQKMRKVFTSKRKVNIEKTEVPYPKTIINRSIIWDYYIRGQRK